MTKHRCGSRKPGAGVTAVGLLLILTGALLLLDNFGILWIDHVWDLWPLALISVGLAELLRWSRQSAS